MVAGHEVLQRIHQSRHEIDAPREPVADVAGAASTNLLAFVSLARAAAGEASVADVLALGSTLLADVMPGSTGAWFLPDAAHDRLVVADAFGPAAAALHGTSVPVGERLTGWVAVRRQPIVNSDATLDLGARVDAVAPPLSRCISLPLMVGDALVAVLTLYTCRARRLHGRSRTARPDRGASSRQGDRCRHPLTGREPRDRPSRNARPPRPSASRVALTSSLAKSSQENGSTGVVGVLAIGRAPGPCRTSYYPQPTSSSPVLPFSC